MLDKTKEVQGVASYFEFSWPGSLSSRTTMFMVTPDGYAEIAGRGPVLVNAVMYRRTISKDEPRKQWKTYSLESLKNHIIERENLELFAGDLSHSSADLDAEGLMRRRMKAMQPFLSWISTNKLELVKTPLLVEVTKTDLADIYENRTPTKIIYRIGQTRRSLGFSTLLS